MIQMAKSVNANGIMWQDSPYTATTRVKRMNYLKIRDMNLPCYADGVQNLKSIKCLNDC